MVYYGIGLNVSFVIPGDIYINFFVITMISVVFLPPAAWILHRNGRKILLCVCMVLGGSLCIGTIFSTFGGKEESERTNLCIQF